MSPQELLEHAKTKGTPMIEGHQATFIWEGEKAPYLLGDFNNWGNWGEKPAELEQLAPNIWGITLIFEADAIMEYVYMDDLKDNKTRRYDPLNKKRKYPNGTGKFNNMLFMPKANLTKLTTVKKDIPRGTVTHHVLEGLAGFFVDNTRDVWLYQPATDEPVPLVVCYDGAQFKNLVKVFEIVDNLIAKKKMKPVALALIDSGKKARFIEYNCGEATLELVMGILLPLAKQHLHLIDVEKHAGAYGIMGASMGGLMALYTGMRYPHIFGHIISQSGAFREFISPEKLLYRQLVDTFPAPPPLKIWMDCGVTEWLIQANRNTAQLLTDKGWDVTYREFNGGHTNRMWGNMLEHALPTIFPYEDKK